MLTATLIRPASLLEADGRHWHRGEPQPISLDEAKRLRRDDRFQIDGLIEALEAAAAGNPEPAPEAAADEGDDDEGDGDDENQEPKTVLDAIAELDIDDETAFNDKGKPTPEALSKVLGREVTQEEVDAALGVPKPTGKLEAEAAPVKTGGVKIVKRGKAKASGKPAAAPADDSTKDAVEV